MVGMEHADAISELTAAVRFRSAAYGELASARAALDEAERRLTVVANDIRWGVTSGDPVLSASLNGREATARLRVEEARVRISEAKRDLQRARQLSAPYTAKDNEFENLD